jgi:dTDP-4-dehydrorhamnose 3,5-epimerase
MKDPKIISGGVAVDDRGSVSFVNDFDFSDVKRFYQVQNHRRGFIRAWHGHKKEAKYVYVPYGSALIGAIPIPNSVYMDEMGGDVELIPGNKGPEKFILSSKSPKVLYIPAGYANGVMSLEENTIVQFFSTSTLEESLGDDERFDYDKWNIWEEDFR